MEASIRQDVAAVLTEMEEHGVRAIGPSAVVQNVIDSFGIHDQQDVRYQEAMIDYMTRIVGKMLNAYKVKAETDDQVDGQLVLPGYKRLQQRYLIHEDGESVAVLTSQIADEVLLGKASELRNMGEGCFSHADEIERYIEERNAAKAI